MHSGRLPDRGLSVEWRLEPGRFTALFGVTCVVFILCFRFVNLHAMARNRKLGEEVGLLTQGLCLHYCATKLRRSMVYQLHAKKTGSRASNVATVL